MMYKKITAIGLSLALTATSLATPVYAAEAQANKGTSITYQKSVAKLDKKKEDKGNKKDDKKDNDKREEFIESILKIFLDSKDIDWAEKSIEKMGALGIIGGYGNGKFKPQSNVTHAEAIAMVVKLSGMQKEAEAIKKQPKFFEGKLDPWSYGYLELALQKGIIIPEEDGKINPKTPAKRHEVAKYIVRAMGMRDQALQNMEAKLEFKDANAIPKTSIGYVYVVTQLQLMKGSKNEWQPNKPITRAEMAVILDRVEDGAELPTNNSATLQGTFAAYDKANSKLTLTVSGKSVTYTVLANAPVYKDSAYISIESLTAGDTIKVILDSQKRIIFIEYKNPGTTTPTSGKLYIQTVSYESLPQALKNSVDALKLTASYTAFKYDNHVYLVAARGQMPTGGYAIRINEVYKEAVETNKFNLKAVVESTEPGNTVVTQAVTYPYHIVKLNYFNGIDKVNFVNTSNVQLHQTTLNVADIVEVINGTIDTVDVSRRIVKLLESDGNIRSYQIPSNALITLGEQTVSLSALTRGMTLAVTKTNGVVTKLAAQGIAQNVETVTGKISTIDTATRIVKLIESDNVERVYYIPATVQITLNNQTAAITSLSANMTAVITKTNGVITRLAATSTQETTSGKITTIDIANRIVKLLESDNIERAYHIPAEVQITINNQTAAFTALQPSMTVVLTKANGVIVRLAATNSVVTIGGKISTVDITNRIVAILESDNVIRAHILPNEALITINNQVVALSALQPNMEVVITKTNGIVTSLTATNVVETFTGKVDSVDTVNRIVKLTASNNTVTSYIIPAQAEILLDNQAAALSNLTNGMNAVITRTNGIITRLTAQSDIQMLEGVFVNTFTSQSKTYASVNVSSVIRNYEVTSATVVLYNGQTTSIQNIPLNTTVTLKLVNGLLTEIKNK